MVSYRQPPLTLTGMALYVSRKNGRGIYGLVAYLLPRLRNAYAPLVNEDLLRSHTVGPPVGAAASPVVLALVNLRHSIKKKEQQGC